MYKIAIVEREITAGEDTRDKAFRLADRFGVDSKGGEDDFLANAKKDSLEVKTASKIDKNARSLSILPSSRELVRWMYNDASIGRVSKVYELDDQYVILALTGITEEGTASLEDVRDQISVKVKNNLKGEKLVADLKTRTGTLEEIAEAMGTDANVYTSADLKLNSNSLPNVGLAPKAVGKAFGLKAGERSEAFAEDNGVLIMEMTALTPAPEIADYTSYKDQKTQSLNGVVPRNLMEAIRDHASIKDARYQFQ